MALTPSSSEGGALPNPLVLTTAGNETDISGGDVFMFGSDSEVELFCRGNLAFLSLKQNALTSNSPFTYARTTAAKLLFSVLDSGAPVVGAIAAPADSALEAGQVTLWLDDTPAASKLMVKAKDFNGAVKTAAIALA